MSWPIFVISLVDAQDRRDFIRKQCAAFGLDFEIIDAIDGRDGLPPELESKIDRVGAQAYMGRLMTDAEFACALSHQLAYERIVKNNLPGAIVLEDDAILTEAFADFIHSEGYLVADFIQMDHRNARHWPWKKKYRFRQIGLQQLAQNAGLATAYSLSNHAAQFVLSQSQPLKGHADWPCDMTPLRPLVAVPRLATQPPLDVIQSTLEAGRLQSISEHRKQNRRGRFVTADYWRRWLRKRLTKAIP
ncbi:MAG TPA: glycosyltransferase family 25 protein [Paracoccus solventivorans]|uniref:Glycosyltransferase family 25 protein n=1 Tax=Paracoccus solventivorans TaxID=53463 RepID=A0A832QWZ4_9RHOB|nr:glycosyltransferase family 25 protein [Paracoccus solventivorans]